MTKAVKEQGTYEVDLEKVLNEKEKQFKEEHDKYKEIGNKYILMDTEGVDIIKQGIISTGSAHLISQVYVSFHPLKIVSILSGIALFFALFFIVLYGVSLFLRVVYTKEHKQEIERQLLIQNTIKDIIKTLEEHIVEYYVREGSMDIKGLTRLEKEPKGTFLNGVIVYSQETEQEEYWKLDVTFDFSAFKEMENGYFKVNTTTKSSRKAKQQDLGK